MFLVNEIKFRVLVLNQTYPKIMKKAILLTLLFLQTVSGFSQTKKLEDVCQVFHLPDGKDTTTFVVWGSKESLKIKKPLFFFRQGSQSQNRLLGKVHARVQAAVGKSAGRAGRTTFESGSQHHAVCAARGWRRILGALECLLCRQLGVFAIWTIRHWFSPLAFE